MVMKSTSVYKHLRISFILYCIILYYIILYYIILYYIILYASYMIQPHLLPSSGRCITKYILQKLLEPMVQEVFVIYSLYCTSLRMATIVAETSIWHTMYII